MILWLKKQNKNNHTLKSGVGVAKSHHVCTCIFYKSLSKKNNKKDNEGYNVGSYLSVCDLSFLSQSFWWSENPCFPLLKELGPAEVGVSL